jgi:ubiquitin-protein ligase E3 B
MLTGTIFLSRNDFSSSIVLMFTSNDQSRKKFIENTRLERENRENERIRKIQEEKELLAVVMIQSWWKRTYQQRKALSESWAWWDALMETAESFSIFDIYQAVGLYCSLSKKATTNKIQPTRLKGIVKCLTTNKFRNPVSNKVIPFYTLLIDMRYMSQSTKYLEMLINHCIKQCTSSNDITNFGPELTFLLQYLNPKTYQTKHDIDPSHVIDIPDKVLQSIAQSTLKRTLCQHNVRDALIACVQQIIKLEDRLKTSSEDTAKINTMKLWLTTMTRLTLYPIEHAEVSSDSLDIQTASNFLSTNTLAVPGLTALINNAMAERLGKWVLISARPYLFISNGRLDNYTAQLSGNGSLFVLANVVDLCRGQREDPMRLTKLVRSFLDVIQPYFSDRQSSQFPHYHPIFKWSKAAWGNQLPSAVFDKVMKQMEYVWSRSFIDWIFVDIIQFDQTTTTNQLEKNCNNNGGELALFSIEMEFVFSMYVRLSSLFKAHRKVIFYRIAFTSRLMPQLWKLMNCFGPKGNMVIYLDAAKRQEIDHEPLVQVLKVFCEACSIVFL